MKRRNAGVLILFVLPLISLLAIQGKSSRTYPIVVTKSKLSGAHAILECKQCHVDVHKPEIDLTICSTCHSNIWDMFQAGPHKGGSGDFEEYCITCHDPHHSEYLWDLNENDWILVNATAPEINDICYQCHEFSPEELDLIRDSHAPLKMTKPPLPSTLVLVLTVIASLVITFMTTVAIVKSTKIKPKPTPPR